jgi:hypothetical protein
MHQRNLNNAFAAAVDWEYRTPIGAIAEAALRQALSCGRSHQPCALSSPRIGGGGLEPPYWLQHPLEQGGPRRIREREEVGEEEEEDFRPYVVVCYIRH